MQGRHRRNVKEAASSGMITGLCGVVVLALAIQNAGAQVIDFSTDGSGNPTTENQTIWMDYVASHDVTFEIIDPVTGEVLPDRPFIGVEGSPMAGFVGCVKYTTGASAAGDNDTLLPGANAFNTNEVVGDVKPSLTPDNHFLTTAVPGGNPPLGDLLITYGTGVLAASGYILDVDRRRDNSNPSNLNGSAYEEFVITAYDGNGAPVGTGVTIAAPLYTGDVECGGGPGDAAAFFWSVSSNSSVPDIKSIEIVYTGTASDVGLAFDNFNVTGGTGELCDPGIIDEFNTGFDEGTGAVIPVGRDDDDWVLLSAPECAGSGFPRPATVASLGPAIADTQWISHAADGGSCLGIYEYQHCFCLPPDREDVALNMAITVSDEATLYLNDTWIGGASPPGTGLLSVTEAADPGLFRDGTNCLRVVVVNGTESGGEATTENNPQRYPSGMDVSGSVTGCGRCPDCARPPRDMVAWWPLDETGPPTASDIVASNDGTHLAGAQPGAGRVDGAIRLDGLDDYVDVPDDPALDPGGGDFSLDAWVEPRASGGRGGVGIIVDKRAGSSAGAGYVLRINAADQLYFTMDDGAGSVTCVGSAPVSQDAWHHAAVTVDRDDAQGLRLYLDGALDATCDPTPVPGSVANGVGLFLGTGRSQSISQCLAGGVDEVELFDRALSAAEISSLASASVSGKCKGRCILPSEIGFCRGSTTKTTDIEICNDSSADQIYTWRLFNPGCNNSMTGPVFIDPLLGTVTVPAGGCVQAPITIQRPSGLVGNATACFDVAVENLDTGKAAASCQTTLRALDRWCVWPSRGRPRIVPGVSEGKGFTAVNEGDADGLLAYEIVATSSDGDPANQVVMLDGNPPGTPVAGTLALAVGEAGVIEVEVDFTEHQPFRSHDVLILADGDGDGTVEALASAGVVSVASAPPPAAPAGVVDLSVTRDQLYWPPVTGAEWYEIVRGDLAALPAGLGPSTRECLAPDHPTSVFDYPALPAAGEGYWLLVRPDGAGGAGTFDSDGPAQAAPRDAAVDGSGAACP